MKLVSLLPSATEIIAKLGLEKNLVGVSHECDFPESVTSLPNLTSSSIDTKSSSPNIHRSVMDVMKSAISVYDLNIELLKYNTIIICLNKLKPSPCILIDRNQYANILL